MVVQRKFCRLQLAMHRSRLIGRFISFVPSGSGSHFVSIRPAMVAVCNLQCTGCMLQCIVWADWQLEDLLSQWSRRALLSLSDGSEGLDSGATG